ncbi:FAD-binding oxidoreductase [Duganella aceris]|uniref:FAD-binding oxidoreductase n=1 Tax=Duganella aceris TaxID=2703883 RepID=A0ABX0FPU0_9BURK|nr:FAD-binding oxidoreductase [Duganella aceris]NGZ86549.1 FAD-binding oxidoreductase [Duganella aceris]
MRIHGWGRYPVAEARVLAPATATQLAGALAGAGEPLIARGLGRSYGDSALAPLVLDSAPRHLLLGFDEHSGVLRCEAGATLADLIAVLLPRGWFPPVTPGTRFVTVGGAVASDVHGKNHHIDGCFSRHVQELELMLADGRVLRCSPLEHPELFRATCGGMGLTGVILTVTLRMRRVASAYIEQTTLRAGSLAEVLELFERHRGASYSVAWIDCLARGASLGRSLLMLGEHAADGGLAPLPGRSRTLPVDLPPQLLNRHSIGAFNALYYYLPRQARQRVHYAPYFYPLDGLLHWNRLYGKAGFVQYQFVIPRAAGAAPLAAILERIAAAGRGSFLAVLKSFGPANDNYLSFPLEGYTLALDFKLEPGLFAMLDELDAMVLAAGGRLYLAKDARMSGATFQRSYPLHTAFQHVRRQYGALGAFASHQSNRLGL